MSLLAALFSKLAGGSTTLGISTLSATGILKQDTTTRAPAPAELSTISVVSVAVEDGAALLIPVEAINTTTTKSARFTARAPLAD